MKSLFESKNLVVVALGGNIGHVDEIAERFTLALNSIADFLEAPCCVSSLYGSAPLGAVLEQPRFTNAVAILSPAKAIAAEELLAQLHAIEASQGRIRQEKDGPRTLDLDLLFFGLRASKRHGLRLPHPRWNQRRFVVDPLVELLGKNAILPGQVLSLEAIGKAASLQVQECFPLGSLTLGARPR